MVYVIQVLLTACERDQDGTDFHPDPTRSWAQLINHPTLKIGSIILIAQIVHLL